MMNLIDIMAPLAQPFALQDIDFLPKSQFEKNGQTMCIGLPFADKRVYEDRLNQVCPGEWSSQMNVIVAGSKIIAVATVTICGVPHTDVGEANMGENSATEAAAQAFKRACSQVGLGRFLYALEKQYLPYDKTKKRFALTNQEMLAAVRSMYRNAGLLSSAPASAPAPVNEEAPASRAATTARTAQAADSQTGQNGKPKPVYYEVYQTGKGKGMWQGIKGFCEFASKELGLDVTTENVSTLAKPRMDQLMAAITGEDPTVAKQKAEGATV